MEKYFIIAVKNGDWDTSKGFDTEEQAIEKASSEWDMISQYDKSKHECFEVVLGGEDEDGWLDISSGYDVIKDFK